MRAGVLMGVLWVIPCLAAGLWHARRRRPARAVAQVDNQFEFRVREPYGKVAPLFGAWAERSWAGKDWNPRFLFPDPPGDRDGMVFLLPHGGSTSTWVNTAFNLETGTIQYVYVLPGVQAVVIDIQLAAATVAATTARVRYRRTALDPGHNERIKALGRQDAQNGPEWASAIEASFR